MVTLAADWSSIKDACNGDTGLGTPGLQNSSRELLETDAGLGGTSVEFSCVAKQKTHV